MVYVASDSGGTVRPTVVILNIRRDHCLLAKCTRVRDVMAISEWTRVENIPKIILHNYNLFVILLRCFKEARKQGSINEKQAIE